MIRDGDNPEDEPFFIKFLTPSEGHRGLTVAIRNDGKEAILRGVTAYKDQLILVRETSPARYPTFERLWVGEVPLDGWKWYGEQRWGRKSFWQRLVAFFLP